MTTKKEWQELSEEQKERQIERLKKDSKKTRFKPGNSFGKKYRFKKGINRKGKNNPHYGFDSGIKKECVICGKIFRVYPYRQDSAKTCAKTCSNKCKNEWFSQEFSGENSSQWRGGKETYYGRNWSRMRKKCLERDKHKCVICGAGKKELGKSPDVHHLIPIKYFKNLEDANILVNLITVCPKHHVEIEFQAVNS